ncbi:ATP-dependent nuclease [Pseudomonas protegens]|uniref:ATP-dependent nuclease n=2 Tax=Pseudomonas protegens TaxID=380021 RepID=UPI001B31B1B1|nr:ATP-binding protein [Pseudomonas protegens]MBP5103814.1 AAA family ATPase [Pseudomonas protegens]MBP5132663.1 AAA family ATPase [Pseudomonas protegens]MBP5149430.1 AAA family ATPase [Pseudomonas protegens]
MFIKKVVLHRFKRYQKASINLKDQLSLVVGGNNSGKSTILQALAAWQFCKTLIEIEKGRRGWVQAGGKTGVGLGIVDFTPLQVPSLAHLWTNLKTSKVNEPDGYTLKINVFWDNVDGEERFLEMGMSLANDRLFVKATSTNLTAEEIIEENETPIAGSVPSVAYLPPFAGITDREGRLTPAMRERFVGQGLSGGVVRNVLFDLHEENKRQRTKLLENRTKLKDSDLAWLRKNDPWEILVSAMQSMFGTDIRIVPFNERWHSYLKVRCVKGEIDSNGFFKSHPGFNARDLMVEGQGFLQWLSVYALSLTPEVNIVLLDEPDAHLNAALQKDLLQSLEAVAVGQGKQILMATHSPELIRLHEHDRILSVAKSGAKYLDAPEGRIKVLSGIGSVHTPTIHSLMQNKRMLILEAPSDLRFLQKLAERAKFKWPQNITPWYWTGTASERLQLFRQLKKEIPELKCISIRDRDDESASTVSESLIDRGFKNKEQDFTVMKWRRRHIEGYLLCKAAIARAANVDVAEIEKFFKKDEHALALPDNTTKSEIASSIRDAQAKEIFTKGDSLKRNFQITRDDVAAVLMPKEIAEDLHTFFKAVEDLGK